MQGLAAALTVTLNALLAASPAAGARAPPHPHTHSRAGKLQLFSLAGVSKKNKNSSLLRKTNTLQEQKT